MKKNVLLPLTAAALLLFGMMACQKELSGSFPKDTDTPADLGSRVNAAVSGFVTAENDEPVQNAIVKFGTQTVNTDAYGYFEISSTSVPKNAAMVTVSQPGYFPGIRSFIALEGKSNFVRIKLLPKTNAGNIDAGTGGAVTLANGLKIALPQNAVVNAASGAAYSGTINLAAQWINPTATDLDRIMPGDLRAVDADNNMKLLVTYGMAAVELTGSAGEKLQIASGKKATLTWPLPAALTSTAPASIPLWYFDENTGLWKEEGAATKTGNSYVGDVSHFSFWNCDVPNNYVQLDMTFKDENGNPVKNAIVKITNTANNSQGTGYTDTSGYVHGAVPNNAQLQLEVFNYYSCPTALYTQTVTTTNTNLSLGVITINTASITALLNGTVVNCSSAPVTNGALYIRHENSFGYQRYALNNGAFSIPYYLCSSGTYNFKVIAEDYTSSQQSAEITYTATTGDNNLGNIEACGTTTEQFFNIDINGTDDSFSYPADSLSYYFNNQNGSNISIWRNAGTGTGDYVNIYFMHSGITVGSAYQVLEFSTNLVSNTISINSSTSTVTITEYGSVGGFIAGTYSINGTGPAPANTPYTITGNFRIRRYN